jgi:hypothetical protein
MEWSVAEPEDLATIPWIVDRNGGLLEFIQCPVVVKQFQKSLSLSDCKVFPITTKFLIHAEPCGIVRGPLAKIVPIGFSHGMECSRTGGFGKWFGIVDRIGRVLVAEPSGIGIIQTIALDIRGSNRRLRVILHCNTLVLPPAEDVWTIISCGAKLWQPVTKILDRNTVILFEYLPFSLIVS